MRGLEFALNDIGLAVFTTLAPAGTFVFMVLSCVVLAGRLPPRQRSCLESWLIVPLAMATVGLIVSATHLGTPSNALYVFARTGFSPLSTEVFAAILFLGCAGSYWLGGLYLKGEALIVRSVRNIWLAASVVAGAFFLYGTTKAYDFWTVVSWNTPAAAANLPLAGAAAAVPAVLAVLVAAGQERRVGLACSLLVGGAAAATGAVVSMAVQHGYLGRLSNGWGAALDLVPLYVPVMVVYAAGQLATLASCLAVLRRFWRCEPPERRVFDVEHRTPEERRARAFLGLLSVASLVLTFMVRFEFYRMHMTAGVV